MDANELIKTLEERGATFQVVGDRLRIAPRESVPPELFEEIRAQKPAIVGLLRSRVSVAAPLSAEGKADYWPLTTEDVLAMPLRQFAGARLVVVAHSQVLGETVVLASDNATVDPGERRVTYRAAELWSLLNLEPASVRTVHEVKRVFAGTIEPS